MRKHSNEVTKSQSQLGLDFIFELLKLRRVVVSVSRTHPEVSLAIYLGTGVSAFLPEVHTLVSGVPRNKLVLWVETSQTELGLDADLSSLLN